MDENQNTFGKFKVLAPPKPVEEAVEPAPGKGTGKFRVVSPEEQTAPVVERKFTPPVDYGKYQQMSASELASAAGRAAPEEGRQMYEFAKSVAADPVEFAKNVGRLYYNLGAKAVSEAGWDVDKETKEAADKTWQSVSEPYKEYFRPGGIQKAIATRPISVAMDLAMPLTLGSSALRSVAPKTAMGLNVAANVLDPVQLAVSTAKGAGNLAQEIGRGTLAVTSSTPRAALSTASTVLNGASPEQRAAFWQGVTGKVTADEIKQVAEKALNAKRQADIDAIKADKKLLNLDAPGSISDFSMIDNKINDLQTRLAPVGSVSRFPEAEQSLLQVRRLVDAYKADPNFQTLNEIDRMREVLWNLRQAAGDDTARKAVDEIYHEVKKMVDNVTGGTEYSSILDNARANMGRVNEITREFGLRAGAGSAVSRMLKKQKVERGVTLLEDLAKYEPRLPYLLAGDAGREFIPQDLWRGAIITGGGIGALSNPALIPHIAGGVAASSPLLATTASVLGGLASNVAGKATSYPVQRTAYLTMLSQIPTTELTPEEQVSVIDQVKPLIASVESAGSGGYSAMGPKFTHKVRGEPYENQALGKYQVLKSNLPEWSRKYYGRELTPQEFLSSPEAQEAIFEGAFGDMLKKHGNVRDAVSTWHSGRPLSEASRSKAKDVLGTTTEDYVTKVMDLPGAEGLDEARIGRKSGGRVSSVDGLVDQLMNQVRKAKRENTKATEPLLNQPDEHIVRALDVAQQAI